MLRDILFVYGQIHNTVRFPNLDLESSVHITNLVFSILRNARALHVGEAPNMIVCWGGHSIQRKRISLRPPRRYAAGPAGTEYLHRLRAWAQWRRR
ncbi:decarboxylase [Klebsiella pneumoniae subsp. rhinoscleromatis]|nr:decarboxylase [Klebsiella pneumoniae subsp. rhinoscleromatis]